MKKILVICGPTATGKTQVALTLARTFRGELVSADSRQVYRGMDIGTGKDIVEKISEKQYELTIEFGGVTYRICPYKIDGVLLWLYDVADPEQDFTVAHYQHISRRVTRDIVKRKKLPIIVGGTGFYIQSIFESMPDIQVAPNLPLRKELSGKTIEQLQRILRDRAPHAWRTLNESDRSNPRRLVRKIEISAATISPQTLPWRGDVDILYIGLTAANTVLYQRIDARVDKRNTQGIIQEVQGLLRKGYSWDLPSMSGLGYRQWKPYFDARQEAREEIYARVIQEWKHSEHAYARRQLTWFKRNKLIHWFDVSDAAYIDKLVATVREWYTN